MDMPSQACSDSSVRDAGQRAWLRDNAEPARSSPSAPPALPPWIPEASWRAFAAMRRAVRGVPFAPEAARSLIARLDRLRRAGHCPARLLDKATARRWRTVFAGADTWDAQLPKRAATRQPGQ